jgi:nucleoside-diphosphate-sugar epimerase
MKCFVTGGSGFVGSNLITKLIDEGFEVLAEFVHMQATEYTISDKKAREELGYEDVVTLEEGLEELRAGL